MWQMFKRTIPDPVTIRGSIEWIDAEKNRLHEDKCWSEYFLTRTLEEWKYILTVEAAIHFYLQLMREGAENNIRNKNKRTTETHPLP